MVDKCDICKNVIGKGTKHLVDLDTGKKMHITCYKEEHGKLPAKIKHISYNPAAPDASLIPQLRRAGARFLKKAKNPLTEQQKEKVREFAKYVSKGKNPAGEATVNLSFDIHRDAIKRALNLIGKKYTKDDVLKLLSVLEGTADIDIEYNLDTPQDVIAGMWDPDEKTHTHPYTITPKKQKMHWITVTVSEDALVRALEKLGKEANYNNKMYLLALLQGSADMMIEGDMEDKGTLNDRWPHTVPIKTNPSFKDISGKIKGARKLTKEQLSKLLALADRMPIPSGFDAYFESKIWPKVHKIGKGVIMGGSIAALISPVTTVPALVTIIGRNTKKIKKLEAKKFDQLHSALKYTMGRMLGVSALYVANGYDYKKTLADLQGARNPLPRVKINWEKLANGKVIAAAISLADAIAGLFYLGAAGTAAGGGVGAMGAGVGAAAGAPAGGTAGVTVGAIKGVGEVLVSLGLFISSMKGAVSIGNPKGLGETVQSVGAYLKTPEGQKAAERAIKLGKNVFEYASKAMAKANPDIMDEVRDFLKSEEGKKFIQKAVEMGKDVIPAAIDHLKGTKNPSRRAISPDYIQTKHYTLVVDGFTLIDATPERMITKIPKKMTYKLAKKMEEALYTNLGSYVWIMKDKDGDWYCTNEGGKDYYFDKNGVLEWRGVPAEPLKNPSRTDLKAGIKDEKEGKEKYMQWADEFEAAGQRPQASLMRQFAGDESRHGQALDIMLAHANPAEHPQFYVKENDSIPAAFAKKFGKEMGEHRIEDHKFGAKLVTLSDGSKYIAWIEAELKTFEPYHQYAKEHFHINPRLHSEIQRGIVNALKQAIYAFQEQNINMARESRAYAYGLYKGALTDIEQQVFIKKLGDAPAEALKMSVDEWTEDLVDDADKEISGVQNPRKTKAKLRLTPLTAQEYATFEWAIVFYLNEGQRESSAYKNAWNDTKLEHARLNEYDDIDWAVTNKALGLEVKEPKQRNPLESVAFKTPMMKAEELYKAIRSHMITNMIQGEVGTDAFYADSNNYMTIVVDCGKSNMDGIRDIAKQFGAEEIKENPATDISKSKFWPEIKKIAQYAFNKDFNGFAEYIDVDANDEQLNNVKAELESNNVSPVNIYYVKEAAIYILDREFERVAEALKITEDKLGSIHEELVADYGSVKNPVDYIPKAEAFVKEFLVDAGHGPVKTVKIEELQAPNEHGWGLYHVTGESQDGTEFDFNMDFNGNNAWTITWEIGELEFTGRDPDEEENPARWKKGAVIQSMRFKKSKWTPKRARKWLLGHGFKAPAVDETKSELRYRQVAPGRIKSTHYGSKPFGKKPMGIRALFGEPNPIQSLFNDCYEALDGRYCLRVFSDRSFELETPSGMLKDTFDQDGEPHGIKEQEEDVIEWIESIGAQLKGKFKNPARTIKVELIDVVVEGVTGLPHGWDYEVYDDMAGSYGGPSKYEGQMTEDQIYELSSKDPPIHDKVMTILFREGIPEFFNVPKGYRVKYRDTGETQEYHGWSRANPEQPEAEDAEGNIVHINDVVKNIQTLQKIPGPETIRRGTRLTIERIENGELFFKEIADIFGGYEPQYFELVKKGKHKANPTKAQAKKIADEHRATGKRARVFPIKGGYSAYVDGPRANPQSRANIESAIFSRMELARIHHSRKQFKAAQDIVSQALGLYHALNAEEMEQFNEYWPAYRHLMSKPVSKWTPKDIENSLITTRGRGQNNPGNPSFDTKVSLTEMDENELVRLAEHIIPFKPKTNEFPIFAKISFEGDTIYLEGNNVPYDALKKFITAEMSVPLYLHDLAWEWTADNEITGVAKVPGKTRKQVIAFANKKGNPTKAQAQAAAEVARSRGKRARVLKTADNYSPFISKDAVPAGKKAVVPKKKVARKVKKVVVPKPQEPAAVVPKYEERPDDIIIQPLSGGAPTVLHRQEIEEQQAKTAKIEAKVEKAVEKTEASVVKAVEHAEKAAEKDDNLMVVALPDPPEVPRFAPYDFESGMTAGEYKKQFEAPSKATNEWHRSWTALYNKISKQAGKKALPQADRDALKRSLEDLQKVRTNYVKAYNGTMDLRNAEEAAKVLAKAQALGYVVPKSMENELTQVVGTDIYDGHKDSMKLAEILESHLKRLIGEKGKAYTIVVQSKTGFTDNLTTFNDYEAAKDYLYKKAKELLDESWVRARIFEKTATEETLKFELDLSKIPEPVPTEGKLKISDIPKLVRTIMPEHQQKVIKGSEEFWDIIKNLQERALEIPEIYAQDGKGDEAIVYLHYFYGGSDWFITEWDGADEFFGFAVLNQDTQNAELGYIQRTELTQTPPIELDFHWSKKTLKEAKRKFVEAEERQEREREIREKAAKLHEPTVKLPGEKEIGKNKDGNKVYEDKDGNRYYVEVSPSSGLTVRQGAPRAVQPSGKAAPYTPYELYKQGRTYYLTAEEEAEFDEKYKEKEPEPPQFKPAPPPPPLETFTAAPQTAPAAKPEPTTEELADIIAKKLKEQLGE